MTLSGTVIVEWLGTVIGDYPSKLSELCPSEKLTMASSAGPDVVESGNVAEGFVTPKKAIPSRLTALISEAKSPALKIPASPLMERLGYGTGVGVYLMERSPRVSGEMRSPWAIKKIAKLRDTKKTYVVRLEHEAKILRELSHPNIVGYRGFGKPGDDGAYLAMEKASACLGDLIEQRFDDFITSCEPGVVPGLDPFPASRILKVGEDVAKALTYLHDEVKMIHGDMKSANVLVFGDFDVIKLCDFGVARKIREDGSIEGEYVGTEIWSPLEIVRKQKGLPHEPITAKVDIYPYGLTLFEMISLKPPHLPTAEDAYDGDESFDEEAFEETLAECIGSRPVLPDIEFDSSYHKILALFFCCTEESPAQRPDARDVLKVFTEDELATACSKVTI